MIQSLQGAPGFVLLGQTAGVANAGTDDKSLVFIDPQSGIQHHIPMTDEQMDQIYHTWHDGKKVIIANRIPGGAQRVNGSG